MKGYGSFCPVAKAAEVLAERWTLLILRDILIGSRRFNEFRRSIPLLSPTLLASRLRSLEEAGVIVPAPYGDGHGWEYRPTQACEELRPVIEAIGHWGQRWVRSDLAAGELDPVSLMWYVHRHLVTAYLPARRTVIYVEFTDLERLQRWWLVVQNGEVDLCTDDPGYEVDVTIYSDLLSLTQIYIGDLPVSRAISTGRIVVSGPRGFAQKISRLVRQEPVRRRQPPSGRLVPSGRARLALLTSRLGLQSNVGSWPIRSPRLGAPASRPLWDPKARVAA